MTHRNLLVSIFWYAKSALVSSGTYTPLLPPAYWFGYFTVGKPGVEGKNKFSLFSVFENKLNLEPRALGSKISVGDGDQKLLVWITVSKSSISWFQMQELC